MRAMIVGAALAAAVMCGLAGEAKASQYFVSANLQSDGAAGSIYISNGSAYVDTYFNLEDQVYTRNTAVFNVAPFISLYRLNGFENVEFLASVKNVDFTSQFIDSSDGEVLSTSNYTKDFFFSARFQSANGSVIYTDVSSSIDIPYSSANYSVTSVPLPASAPLFGAALVALGGATYARRRMKAA